MPAPPRIHRRTLLRGAAGVGVALPFLEAMIPARARAAAYAAPKRLLVWTAPNGTVTDRWICKVGASERDFTLSEILAPLERHKQDLVGIQNLKQYAGYGHQYATTLTGRRYTDRGYPKIYATGPSLDQHIATRWEGRTPVPSLQVGLVVTSDRETSSCLSWADTDRPLPAENSPYALYNQLFTNGSTGAQREVNRLFSSRRSVIDSVLTQTGALAPRLGVADRAVLDNYLESVRAVEKQMVALESKTAQCTAPTLPPDRTMPSDKKPYWLLHENVPEIIKIQMGLITAILACDLTRVITFTLAGSGGGSRNHNAWIPEAPKGYDWHGVSHQVEKGFADGLAAIDRWYSVQLATMIDGLKAVKQPDGQSLLWSSLVLTNNEYGANGPISFLPLAAGQAPKNFTHTVSFMPYLLFGQAGGALKTGRYLVAPLTGDPQTGSGPHHNRLFVSVLNALDIPDTTFGEAKAQQGPLPGLLG